MGYWGRKLARDYLPIPPEFAAAGHTLRPCVATVFGGWHPDTHAFLRDCAQRAAATAPCMPQAGDLAAFLLGRWVARLGIAIARENAALLRRCAHVEGAGGQGSHWGAAEPLWWELECRVAAQAW